MKLLIKSVLLFLAIVLVSCVSVEKKYPENWWQDSLKENKKSWEILPSEVKYPQVILSKRNELGLLSNFAETPFVYQNKKFKSIEGFWQATKFPENSKDVRFKMARWPMTRLQVEQLSGFAAKRAGDFASQVMKNNNIDWVSFRDKKMIYKEQGESEFYLMIYAVSQEKVRQNPQVKLLLEKTKGLELLPDHKQEINAPLAWRYYKIYEKIREQL